MGITKHPCNCSPRFYRIFHYCPFRTEGGRDEDPGEALEGLERPLPWAEGRPQGLGPAPPGPRPTPGPAGRRPGPFAPRSSAPGLRPRQMSKKGMNQGKGRRPRASQDPGPSSPPERADRALGRPPKRPGLVRPSP